MIEDLALRWTVTILFAISAGECLVTTFTGQRRWTVVVGNVLHVLMAVAMAVMAWPQGAALPTTAPMVFFMLAAVWFLVLILIPTGVSHRIGNLYHVVMMLAMAWMYAVMNGNMLPGRSSAVEHPMPGMDHHDMHMPEMDHRGVVMPAIDDGVDVMTRMGDPSVAYPVWVSTINWLCAIGFAVATAYWFYRYLTKPGDDATELAHGHLGALCQAMMAGGMATMFGLMI